MSSMSSARDECKRKKDHHHHHRHRSRSPSHRKHDKDRTHRSDKYNEDSHERTSSRDREFHQKKIKQEPDDDGYREHKDVRQRDEDRYRDRKQDQNRHAQNRDKRHEQINVQIKQERDRHDERRRENKRQRGHENPFQTSSSQVNSAGQNQADGNVGENPQVKKEEPNFGLSGALAEDTNTFRGVVIKYNEPPEARKPKRRWRLYIFKGEEELPTLHIHRQSAYLLGRERLIADIPIDHPSCSKQHAVIQYRLVEYDKDNGTTGKRVRPYIIDLESANGTFLNNNKIEPRRYYEMQEKDVLKFGFSSREYVVLHDKSSTGDLDEVEDSN